MENDKIIKNGPWELPERDLAGVPLPTPLPAPLTYSEGYKAGQRDTLEKLYYYLQHWYECELNPCTCGLTPLVRSLEPLKGDDRETID